MRTRKRFFLKRYILSELVSIPLDQECPFPPHLSRYDFLLHVISFGFRAATFPSYRVNTSFLFPPAQLEPGADSFPRASFPFTRPSPPPPPPFWHILTFVSFVPVVQWFPRRIRTSPRNSSNDSSSTVRFFSYLPNTSPFFYPSPSNIEDSDSKNGFFEGAPFPPSSVFPLSFLLILSLFAAFSR